MKHKKTNPDKTTSTNRTTEQVSNSDLQKLAEKYIDELVDNFSIDDLAKGNFLTSENLSHLITQYLGSKRDPRLSIAQFLIDSILNKNQVANPFKDHMITDFDFVKAFVGRVTSRPDLLMKVLPYVTGKKKLTELVQDQTPKYETTSQSRLSRDFFY